MKEEIDWKKELLESGKFNNQFSKNILENGAKNYICQHREDRITYSKIKIFN